MQESIVFNVVFSDSNVNADYIFPGSSNAKIRKILDFSPRLAIKQSTKNATCAKIDFEKLKKITDSGTLIPKQSKPGHRKLGASDIEGFVDSLSMNIWRHDGSTYI